MIEFIFNIKQAAKTDLREIRKNEKSSPIRRLSGTQKFSYTRNLNKILHSILSICSSRWRKILGTHLQHLPRMER